MHSRTGISMVRGAARARIPGGNEVIVEERVDQCADGDTRRVQDQACVTSWTSSEGLPRAVAPFDAPCEPEYSQHVIRGRRNLKSMYSDCKYEITAPDVPGDDLGVLSNFRNLVQAAMGMGVGDLTVQQAAMAATTTLTAPTAGFLMLGAWFKFSFQFSLTTTLNVTAQIATVTTVSGAVACGRTISFLLREGCTSAEFFLPLAATEAGGTLWAPRVGIIIVGPPSTRLIITGLPANAGTVQAKFCGPHDPVLQRIAGAMNNA